jgi:hypothetical protein
MTGSWSQTDIRRSTDIAPGNDHITSGIGAVMIGS